MNDKKSKNCASQIHQIEIELVEKIQKGDEYAFKNLFKTFYQPLVNHAYRYVNDKHIAENIVEDVFLKIWDNRKNWNISISIKAYLFQSVRNHSINYLKRLEVERIKVSDLLDTIESVKTPEDYLSEKEMTERIQQAIAELPERARCVFMMHRYDQLKYAEIAEILNISVGTVETHMVRALKFLRNRLIHFLFILT